MFSVFGKRGRVKSVYSDRQLNSASHYVCFNYLEKNNKANSENPDETAHNEPSHLDFHYLQTCVRIYLMSKFTRLYPSVPTKTAKGGASLSPELHVQSFLLGHEK